MANFDIYFKGKDNSFKKELTVEADRILGTGGYITLDKANQSVFVRNIENTIIVRLDAIQATENKSKDKTTEIDLSPKGSKHTY